MTGRVELGSPPLPRLHLRVGNGGSDIPLEILHTRCLLKVSRFFFPSVSVPTAAEFEHVLIC